MVCKIYNAEMMCRGMPKEWGMAKIRVPQAEPRDAYSMNAMLREHKVAQHFLFFIFFVIPTGYP